jgi:aspartokinase-like uncharacterized kinase
VDAVIKLGGSLLENPAALKALGVTLCRIGEKYRVMVVPGGGKFADAVRTVDEKFGLLAATSHRMAILAMDQYGLLLSHFIPHAHTCDSLTEAKRVSENKLVSIFLPSKLLLEEDPFKPSWDITSDSIAAYLATKLHAAKTVFVTDVDGIFSADPKKDQNAKLLDSVPATKLLELRKRTSVDKFLPNFLIKNSFDCYVVNGFYSERVANILLGKKAICTQILTS